MKKETVNNSDLQRVKQNGFVLEFIEKQTPAICKIAVNQNSNALQFVRKQNR